MHSDELDETIFRLFTKRNLLIGTVFFRYFCSFALESWYKLQADLLKTEFLTEYYYDYLEFLRTVVSRSPSEWLTCIIRFLQYSGQVITWRYAAYWCNCINFILKLPLLLQATSTRLKLMVEVSFTAVAAIAVGFAYSWKLTLLVLAFVPFLLIGGILHAARFKNFAAKEGKRFSEASIVRIFSFYYHDALLSWCIIAASWLFPSSFRTLKYILIFPTIKYLTIWLLFVPLFLFSKKYQLIRNVLQRSSKNPTALKNWINGRDNHSEKWTIFWKKKKIKGHEDKKK